MKILSERKSKLKTQYPGSIVPVAMFLNFRFAIFLKIWFVYPLNMQLLICFKLVQNLVFRWHHLHLIVPKLATRLCNLHCYMVSSSVSFSQVYLGLVTTKRHKSQCIYFKVKPERHRWWCWRRSWSRAWRGSSGSVFPPTEASGWCFRTGSSDRKILPYGIKLKLELQDSIIWYPFAILNNFITILDHLIEIAILDHFEKTSVLVDEWLFTCNSFNLINVEDVRT